MNKFNRIGIDLLGIELSKVTVEEVNGLKEISIDVTNIATYLLDVLMSSSS